MKRGVSSSRSPAHRAWPVSDVAQARSRRPHQHACASRQDSVALQMAPARRRSGAPGIFPARSPSTSISRSRPARNFFRRAFSCSTVFSRRTSIASRDPKRWRQAWMVGPETPCRLATPPPGCCLPRHAGPPPFDLLIRKPRFLHPLRASSAGAIFSKFTWSENQSAVFASAIQ